MNMKKLIIPVLAVSVLLGSALSVLPGTGDSDFSYTPGGEIRLKHFGLELKFDEKMHGQAVLGGKGTVAQATHFLVVDGQVVKDFSVDYHALRMERVKTRFGAARRLVIHGSADGPHESRIAKALTVDLYDKYPDMIIMQATYTVTRTAAPLGLEQAVSSAFRLDASALDATAKPYEFWSFQGGSYDWGKDDVVRLSPGFTQDNFLGMVSRRVGNDTQTFGGGIPLVDLWTKSAGLAIAHLSPKQAEASMPVRVEEDQRVSVSVVEKPEIQLAVGEHFTTLETLLTAHTGDFYEPLRRYASLMAEQGIAARKPNQDAYQSSWCGWGYEFNFKPEEMLGVRPKLKEMGIRWVTIDDRWFTNYGDWEPRSDTFPSGVTGIKKMVDEFHRSGNKVQLWWYPLAVEASPGRTESHVFTGARIAREHPEWLILDRSGKPAVWSRNLNILCPAVPGVREYIRQLTRKFVQDWGIDGHKLDVVYTAPPCYNKAHGHATPEESVRQFPEVLRIIYETTLAAKPDGVVQICPCGTTPNVYWLPYLNQAVTADPIGAGQVRNRIKMYKALLGPRAAVYSDHVELTDMKVLGQSDYREEGRDFASAVGTGGVPGTKFVWPETQSPSLSEEELKPRRQNLLTPEKEEHWAKWMSIYNRLMLSQGEYLNLYDIAYDLPETHVVRKDGKMYYAFYVASGTTWNGPIELRGLAPGKYQVYDYVNEKELATLDARHPVFTARFMDHLLIEARPVAAR